MLRGALLLAFTLPAIALRVGGYGDQSIHTVKSHHYPPLTPDPYASFVSHFSSDKSGTEVVLQTHIASFYPNSSIVVTKDYRFDLLRFAAASVDPVAIRPLDDIRSLREVLYVPPIRRRDGDGALAEHLLFAGYKVAWRDFEFTAIVATWNEPFMGSMVQWHIIGDSDSAGRDLVQACLTFSSSLHEAILVFEQSFWRPDHALWLSIQQASWDDVILDKSLKDAVTHDYRSFFKSEDVYKNFQVPWKRGLIFLGPPGNGKTVSLKAIMNEVAVPILYVKTFHTYAGDEFGIRQIFQRARAEAPCMLVLEDLDSLVTDINRSFFLNELDGIEDNDGLLLVGTTNHFERLDPALSNRPSRFDRKYNFPNPSEAERRQYAVYWQHKLHSNKDIDFPDSLLDDFAAKTDKFSFAYMKEAFVSTLLTLAGRETSPKKSDFGHILIDQVKHLREELETGSEVTMTSSWSRSSESEVPSEMGMAQSSAMPAQGTERCFTLDFNPADFEGRRHFHHAEEVFVEDAVARETSWREM